MPTMEKPRVQDVPEYVIDQLARGLVKAVPTILKFYEDPENQRKFEEWKARKYGNIPSQSASMKGATA